MTNNTQNTLIPGLNPGLNQSSLPQWSLILVEGQDAANFLQNQLSNSVLGLNATLPTLVAQNHDSIRLVGYCNPKGRLLASAWVGLFKHEAAGEDRFALFISKDIAANIAKRLSMYVLRSKVKVFDASSDWQISCVLGGDTEVSEFKPEPDQIALRLPDVFLEGQGCARLLIAQPATKKVAVTEGTLVAWNYLEVMSAIPRIVLQTQEQFVPQMINFESVAGVDFKKGCYPGQEIVARSQYRGAIKRRLQLAHITAQPLEKDFITPGAEVFHSDDPTQPAGMVVLSSPNPSILDRVDLQIECKLEALETGELHLGNAQGPVLKIDTLPYPLIEI